MKTFQARGLFFSFSQFFSVSINVYCNCHCCCCSWLFTLIICNAKRAFIDGLECDWLHCMLRELFFLCTFWVRRKKKDFRFFLCLNIFEFIFLLSSFLAFICYGMRKIEKFQKKVKTWNVLCINSNMWERIFRDSKLLISDWIELCGLVWFLNFFCQTTIFVQDKSWIGNI